MLYFRIAILLLGSVLSGCSSLFESDNQAPPTELTDYTPSITIKTLWSKDIGASSVGQSLRLLPAFANGKLFVADADGLVQAIDANSGDSIWQAKTEALISSGPGLGSGKILIGTRKAEVIALSIEDGHEMWRVKVSSEIIAVPVVADGTAVVHTMDGRIYGLNAETGERKWTYNRSEPTLTLRGSSSPVIDHDSVIIGLANGVLANLVLATGDPRWETVVSPPKGRSELERIDDIDATPALKDGVVYAATYQGEVVGIDQTSGIALWHRKMSVYTDLAIDNKRLYVTDATSHAWGLDLHSGSALWQQDKLLNRYLTAPAVLGNYLLVGDLDGYVHWLACEDGSQQARIHISSAPITAPPLVINDVAYIYASNGTVTAITKDIDPPTSDTSTSK